MIWDLLGKIAIVLGILVPLFGIGGWLANKRFAFIKWIQNRRLLKKRQRQGEIQYLNGLVKLLPKEKNILLNEALRARENYQHEEAIAKFKLLLTQTSNTEKQCAFLDLIGINQRSCGDLESAEQTFSSMIKIAKGSRLKEAQYNGLYKIGHVYLLKGDIQRAEKSYEAALNIAKALRNEGFEAIALGSLGNIHFAREEFDEALNLFKASLKISERINNSYIAATQIGSIGHVYSVRGESEKAQEYYRQALEVAERIGDLHTQANSLIGMAIDDSNNSLRLLQDALKIAKQIRDPIIKADALVNIGVQYGKAGSHEKALGFFEEAHAIYEEVGAKDKIAKCEYNMAGARSEIKKRNERE